MECHIIRSGVGWFILLHIVLQTCTIWFMHQFNMSFVLHFYILGLTSWIWTNPSKWNSREASILNVACHRWISAYGNTILRLNLMAREHPKYDSRISPDINLGLFSWIMFCPVVSHKENKTNFWLKFPPVNYTMCFSTLAVCQLFLKKII